MRWTRRMQAQAIGGRRAELEEHYQMNAASASPQLSELWTRGGLDGLGGSGALACEA